MTRVVLTDDLETCQAIRRVVFIEEQGVPEADELDGRDGDALHFLAFDGDRAIGTARVLLGDAVGKIGRVAVLADERGRGVGIALINAAVAEIQARRCGAAKLGAQKSAIGFYERLGFAAEGPEYMDAGIPHQDMVKAV